MALSPAYQKAHEEALGHTRYLKAQHAAEQREMELGPRMEGHWIAIPSVWYDAGASAFWKSLGARFVKYGIADRHWILDTRRARYNGRRYSPAAWLRSIRRKYYHEFYPEFYNELAPFFAGQVQAD